MTETPPANSYDLAPYPRLSHFFSHPEKAATLAYLLGLTPPPVEHCRVLELGCASGGNLIPMAVAYPGSEFVGIDYSGRQVAEGQADIQRLGLANIALQTRDLQTIAPSFGQFDYILAHGLYSWVPAPVRDKLLEICHANLAPAGVAFVSYNTYPGWHSLEAIRRMMLYHVRETEPPAERAAGARALLGFLVEMTDSTEAYGAMLAEHQALLQQEGAANQDAYLLHDHLEDVNAPVYFHEFDAHAARHGLQYLCEAEFRMDFPANFPAAKMEALARLAHNLVELEQYMDFIRNRTFRQTLLVHADQPVNRRLNVARLQKLWVGSLAKPEAGEVNLERGVVAKFIAHDEAKLATNHPLSKAAMVCLMQQWPACLPFATLAAEARARLAQATGEPDSGPLPPEELATLAGTLLQAFTHSENLVELHAAAPRYTLEVNRQARPVASPWARLQAEAGPSVTNLRHERIRLGPLQAYLLRQLDGTRDYAALEADLEAQVRAGALTARQDDQVITDPQKNLELLTTTLEAKLGGLARAALLMRPGDPGQTG